MAATGATGEALSAPGIASVNTFEAHKTVAPKPVSIKAAGGKQSITLAPASVTVLALEQ